MLREGAPQTKEKTKMRTLRNTKWAGVAATAVLAVALVVTAYGGKISIGKKSGGLWLSHFLGDEVIVTFLTAPPEMGRSVKARLMDAEIPGVVLELGKEEIFFPYANISSIEPAQ